MTFKGKKLCGLIALEGLSLLFSRLMCGYHIEFPSLMIHQALLQVTNNYNFFHNAESTPTFMSPTEIKPGATQS